MWRYNRQKFQWEYIDESTGKILAFVTDELLHLIRDDKIAKSILTLVYGLPDEAFH